MHSLARKRVKVYSGNMELDGTVQCVTDEGALIVETEMGDQEILSAEKIDILE
ncbi:MAG: hypothetical protein JW794_08115 [Candidatus Cloacimonetes bacterium]|nr:hypothetical protein [Candidatus Cloacimonadota bacterium]